MAKTYLTEEGFKKLKEELEYLKTVRRQEIAKRIHEAKELGDLSENAEYSAAKDAKAESEIRIGEIEKILKESSIIEEPKKIGVVQIGSTVEAENGAGSHSFTIVGRNESNPVMGKISNESPLGAAFLGKKVSDNVIIKTPKGTSNYKIKKII